jgi:type VI secretion system protein ImpL
MKKWLFPAIIVIGLLAFALIVWFAFPLIGFGDVAPFESEWVRIAIILVVWLAVGLFYGVRWLLHRRQAKQLEEGLLAQTEGETDSSVLNERMVEALQTLKGSSGKSNYLYNLPWYIIIGPPGAGKTTALLKSGMKFPLAGPDGGASVAGTGGTRYCDWWFTDEAVLIDTAGRYTTQDSDAEADKKSWLGFLGLLKRNRPRQPINGVIVAISLEDVMTLSASDLALHSAAIRKRLIEMHQQLKIDFPVYALFTKADLVVGFNEYFGNFTEQRRRKVWGATFQTEDRKKNMIGQVPAEYDLLVKRLTEELPDRLQEEPDAISRISIFGFPAQFAMLKERVNDFLRQIFEPNRYQVNANLRGFYFSSGTQEGTPIDQVLGAMDRSFGSGQALRQLSGLGKSYFIHDLFTTVIFNETGWVSTDMAALRRSAYFRYGAFAVIALVTLLLLGGWGWSYYNNDQLIQDTDRFVADYRVNAADELNATSVSDTDVMKVLPALDLLRNNPVGYAHRTEGVPLNEGFGLSQRDRLIVASESSYRQALERMFRSRLILRLEEQLNETMNDPMATYEALKVYMMLGGKAPKTDPEFVVAWMKQDWDARYPGSANKQARDELEEHLRAMLSLDVAKRPSFELNGIMIDQAQRTLTRLSVADQAYAYLKSLTPPVPIEEFNVALRAGPEADQVFETLDGSDLNTLVVPALFTYRGFHDDFLASLPDVADQLSKEEWVRGEVGQSLVTEEKFAQLGPQLLNLYTRDFIDAWNKVLNNLKLKTLPGDKPDYTTLSVAANSASSPIKLLIQAIADETQLTKEPETLDTTATAGNTQDAAAIKKAQNEIKNRLTSQATGLKRIGIQYALEKATGRPGDQAAAGGSDQEPGANIEAQFKDYVVLLNGSPSAVDGLIGDLYDIYRNLVISATTPSQADQAQQAVQLQVANLRMASSRFPTTFRRLISDAVDDLEGDAAGSTKAQLNDALANNVTRACQQYTSNLYPFSSNSSRDLPMGDFARLFAPNGILDQFFAQNLAQYADMSGDTWKWKDNTALGKELSANALLQFQRAAQIRDAFFPPNSQLPGVNLTIGYAGLGQGVQQALMEVNGTVIQIQPVGSVPVALTWPGGMGSGIVSVSLQPDMPGRQSNVVFQGPWALMRMIRAGASSSRNNVMIVNLTIGGRGVAYKIQVDSIVNPFFLKALSDFSCPTGL